MQNKHDFPKLYTPGPTHIPERILSAMNLSDVHHRTPEFREVFSEAQRALQELVDAAELPIFLAGSARKASISCRPRVKSSVF